mgnify:CR=1 FL=1
MEIAHLDNLLLELTDSERAYRAGAHYDWSDALGQANQADVDGRHIRKIGNPTLALRQEGMPEGLSIVRNSRFNPVPEHVHDYVEISYVYRGCAPQVVNGAALTLAQNEVLLLDAACPHAVGELGEHDIMLSVIISRSMLRRSLEQSLSPASTVSSFLINALTDETDHRGHVHFRTGSSRRVRRYMQEMLCERLEPTPASPQIVSRLFELLLVELIQSYEVTLLQTDEPALPSAQVAAAMGYIERHARDCTLDDLSRHLHLSPNYASALLKRQTGRTFMQLVQESRLTRAAALLDTGATAEAAAREVGYANMSFFYKKFAERYGCTPAAYRRHLPR